MTAWLSKAVCDQMITEADRGFPNETGGVLIGYWAIPSQEVVVTAAIGPGSRALHEKDRFIPDPEHQESEIARHYQDSGRLHTYLGDWHTHPHSRAHMSRLDRRTLEIIACHPAARAPIPIMAILAGGTPWVLRLWRGSPLRLGRAVVGIKTSSFKVKVF
jgi:integrative and conjugative element protein (TIGR02256 family)